MSASHEKSPTEKHSHAAPLNSNSILFVLWSGCQFVCFFLYDPQIKLTWAKMETFCSSVHCRHIPAFQQASKRKEIFFNQHLLLLFDHQCCFQQVLRLEEWSASFCTHRFELFRARLEMGWRVKKCEMDWHGWMVNYKLVWFFLPFIHFTSFPYHIFRMFVVFVKNIFDQIRCFFSGHLCKAAHQCLGEFINTLNDSPEDHVFAIQFGFCLGSNICHWGVSLSSGWEVHSARWKWRQCTCWHGICFASGLPHCTPLLIALCFVSQLPICRLWSVLARKYKPAIGRA